VTAKEARVEAAIDLQRRPISGFHPFQSFRAALQAIVHVAKPLSERKADFVAVKCDGREGLVVAA
jgi:hypothetical protein